MDRANLSVVSETMEKASEVVFKILTTKIYVDNNFTVKSPRATLKAALSLMYL